MIQYEKIKFGSMIVIIDPVKKLYQLELTDKVTGHGYVRLKSKYQNIFKSLKKLGFKKGVFN